MADLSLATIHILASSKIILLVFLCLMFWSWRRQARPVVFMIWTALAIIIFYVVLASPLQKMWWGTTGDELYVAAFLEKVISGQFWSDFYYAYLPTFYPPLYFWLTGGIAQLFAHNAIVAAKIGTTLTLVVWFFASFFGFKWFWAKIYKDQENKPAIISQAWFWWLWPTLYLLLLDFDVIMLKPYEAVSALFLILWLMLWSVATSQVQWPKQYFWWFGLSGGLLFLLFYFWWLIIIPVLLVLAISQDNRRVQLKRLLLVGLIIFIVASPYLLPLLWSAWHYGWENWLATFFVPSDFFTFNPWSIFSVRGIFWLVGLAGLSLAYHKEKYIKVCTWTLLACYLYQVLGLLLFVFGAKPILPAKPFMFLGTAIVAVGIVHILFYIYQHWQATKSKYLSVFTVLVFLILLTQLPMLKFIDDPKILAQVEKDLVLPQATVQMADIIKSQVPDYQTRTWLSSGWPELNAYLPLSYYVVYSPHFSHPASVYSQRLAEVKSMSTALSPDDFMKIIEQGQPKSIDALLLFSDPASPQNYILYFWQDNYPNGGKDSQIYLAKNLISDQDWQMLYNKDNWSIFIRK